MMLELAFALGFAQQAEPATVKELGRIEHQLAATWKAGDCAGWGALLSDDWSVTHIDATVIPKAKALEMCKAPRDPIEEHKLDELTFRVFGDSAVVTGRTFFRTGGAKPVTLTLRFTDVFIHRDGRWLVAASHATRLDR